MSDEPEYGLVMPFVVCKTQGGPYDDTAFVAGARFGALSAQLDVGPDEVQSYEPPALVPQLDLLAMRYGYTLTSEPWDEHPDEWTLVTFTKETAARYTT